MRPSSRSLVAVLGVASLLTGCDLSTPQPLTVPEQILDATIEIDGLAQAATAELNDGVVYVGTGDRRIVLEPAVGGRLPRGRRALVRLADVRVRMEALQPASAALRGDIVVPEVPIYREWTDLGAEVRTGQLRVVESSADEARGEFDVSLALADGTAIRVRGRFWAGRYPSSRDPINPIGPIGDPRPVNPIVPVPTPQP